MKVNERLKTLIRNKGLKQCSVAEKAGFNENQFSQMLNGRRQISADELEIICNAMGVSPNDVYRLKV